MSDVEAFNNVLQKELKAIAERSLQIENLNALNLASYATIKDVFARHPALAKQESVAIESKVDSPAVTRLKEIINSAPYEVLPSFGLFSSKSIQDKHGEEWRKIEDTSQAQLLSDIITKLFGNYMSPSVAGKMEFGIICRGFIKPITRDGDIESSDYPITVNSLSSETIDVNNDWVLAKTGMYGTSFFTYKFNDDPSTRLWYSVRVNDEARIVFDLGAKTEKDFVTLYIRKNVTQFSSSYFDKIFTDLNDELRRIAIYASTHS